jgi:hypothetical protein
MMDVVYTHCCGLDIHKKTVVACLITSTPGAEPVKTIRTFRTMTADLLALADWLHAAGCTHVAMESTGVYVRRITARAISLAEGTGSEGNPWVNDSPGGESQGGQQHVVEAERPRSRVWSGSARPVCYGESLVA